MSTAAALIFSSKSRRGRQQKGVGRALHELALAASSVVDETVLVVDDEALIANLAADVTVLLDESGTTELEALRVAIDWCARAGHSSLVVAFEITAVSGDGPFAPRLFEEVARTNVSPIVLGARIDRRAQLCRLDASVWPAVPLTGPFRSFLDANRQLVVEVASAPRSAGDVASKSEQTRDGEPESSDTANVAELLGRRPQGPFHVVVRDALGEPVVIENGPFLDDGTPMPTRFWLVGRGACRAVARLESQGGAASAEAAIGLDKIAEAHRAYAKARDALIDEDRTGPRPHGGVGGTRRGVKCLHAHLAAYLAGTGDPVGRWVVAQIGDELDAAVAAIDCGTNSTRLLISDPTGRPLERLTTITRLGEGVDRSGQLLPEAVERTLGALSQYRIALDRRGVVRARAVATSAARDAANAPQFFGGAEEILGFAPELLSGEEEGRLSYLGATAELVGDFLVVDLGGGSTELITHGEGVEEEAVVSLPVGCVRMTERFLLSDPPSPSELVACRSYVGELVEKALEDEPALLRPKMMVGVAGTVSTLASLALGLDVYDPEKVHHARITRGEVEELLASLAAEPLAARTARSALEPGRASVIVAGTAVLAEVMARTGHDELLHSETDILDGIVADLLVRR